MSEEDDRVIATRAKAELVISEIEQHLEEIKNLLAELRAEDSDDN